MKSGNAGRSTHARVPSVMSTWLKKVRKRTPVPVGIAEKEQVLDEALDEYVRLQEEGTPVEPTKFCERYPTYKKSLHKLIEVHNALEGVEASVEAPHWPKPTTEFLGFQILGELGVGAFARVYLGAETALGGRLVALKVSQHGGYEAETLGKLTHPHVVPVHSVQFDPATEMTAVCMPYLGNATLDDLLDLAFEDGKAPTTASMIIDAACRRANLVGYVDAIRYEDVWPGGESDKSEPEVPSIAEALERGDYVDGIVHLGIQLASALEYTHKRGILHRDLKPSNVLLTPDGVPMLLDFNLATDREQDLPKLGGTLAYMPSEQIEDVHLRPYSADLSGDPRSDIFSLGVILFELLTGQFPFGDPPVNPKPKEAAKTYLEAQKQPPRSLAELNPAVGRYLDETIRRCLDRDMSARPQSAAKLKAELQEHFERQVRSRRRRFLISATALTLGVSSSIGAYYATRPPAGVLAIRAAVADLRRGDPKSAVRHLERATAEYGESDELILAKGVACQLSGDHKRAYSLLSAGSAENTLALECRAYSALRARSGTSRIERYKLARQCYGLIPGQDNHPGLLLNHACAHLLLSSPHGVVYRATSALMLQPDWQEAHHLRGIGWCQQAEEAKRLDQRDEYVENAIRDLERAIELGTPDLHLYLDAAKAYAMRRSEVPPDRFVYLAAQAAQAGAAKYQIMEMWQGYDEVWMADYPAILANASNDFSIYNATSRDERFLTPPNYERIYTVLANFSDRLAKRP